MHVDERGVWSANVTMFGAWAVGMDYTFDFLMRAPPSLAPRRRRIDRDGPWFSLVDLELPVAAHRGVPLSLHVAGITGTLLSEAVENELLYKADLVLFHAEVARYQLERTKHARAALEPWIEMRDPALVVYQLDRPGDQGRVSHDGMVEEPLSHDQLRAELSIGDRPVVETNAYNNDCGSLFRVVVQELLAARARLPHREPYA